MFTVFQFIFLFIVSPFVLCMFLCPCGPSISCVLFLALFLLLLPSCGGFCFRPFVLSCFPHLSSLYVCVFPLSCTYVHIFTLAFFINYCSSLLCLLCFVCSFIPVPYPFLLFFSCFFFLLPSCGGCCFGPFALSFFLPVFVCMVSPCSGHLPVHFYFLFVPPLFFYSSLCPLFFVCSFVPVSYPFPVSFPRLCFLLLPSCGGFCFYPFVLSCFLVYCMCVFFFHTCRLISTLAILLSFFPSFFRPLCLYVLFCPCVLSFFFVLFLALSFLFFCFCGYVSHVLWSCPVPSVFCPFVFAIFFVYHFSVFFSMPSPDFRCLFLLHDFLIPFLTLFVVWFVSFPCFFFSFCLCSYSPSLSFCSLYVYPFPLKFAFAWLCRKTVEHGET